MANGPGAPRARRTPLQALALLDAGAGRLGADLRRRLPGRVRHRPARHLEALRRQAPALDLLPRPLRRAGGGARQPVRRRRSTSTSCRPTCRPPSSPSRTGSSTTTSASTRGAWPGPELYNLHPPRARRCRAARPSPSSSPATSSSRPTQNDAPQGAGADPGGLAGDQVLQEADPGALSQPGELRRRRLRHRGRLAALLQQAGRPADARRGGAAGGDHEGAVALQSGRQHRPRRRARHRWCWTRWSRPARSRRPQRDAAFAAPVRVSADAGQPARAVLHRLARRPGPRPGRQGADRGPGGRDHARPADPGRRRAGGARRRRRPRRARACSRARWWRSTARAASAPTSAAPPTPTASSTAPPRPSARPARRSSRSST